MSRLLQRIALFTIFGVVFAGVSLQVRASQAQTGHWEYVDALGGYLDWDTGLVWGEQKGIGTWNGSVTYMSTLSARTGFPWRQPTVAECQLAAAHGIASVPSVTVEGRGIIASGRDCWTSDTQNKGSAKFWHYAVFFWGLEVGVNKDNNGSLIDTIPVYRAFTP